MSEVERYNKLIKENYAKVIGQTMVRLDNSACRLTECNIGNAIADSMINYYLKSVDQIKGWTDKPIAIMNGGTIRSGIDKPNGNGTITLEDLLSILPFSNTITIMELTGKILKQMLEHSVTGYDETGQNAQGRFLQYSGLIVKYNMTKPEYQRVDGVLVRCSRCRVPKYLHLREKKKYKVIINSYIAEGGDNFTMLNSNEVIKSPYDDLISDVFAEYIKTRSPLWPGIEYRIIMTK